MQTFSLNGQVISDEKFKVYVSRKPHDAIGYGRPDVQWDKNYRYGRPDVQWDKNYITYSLKKTKQNKKYILF